MLIGGLALIVIGLVRAGRDERLGGQPLEMATLLLWTAYAMSIVTIAGLMCVEPWYRRRAERFRADRIQDRAGQRDRRI